MPATQAICLHVASGGPEGPRTAWVARSGQARPGPAMIARAARAVIRKSAVVSTDPDLFNS